MHKLLFLTCSLAEVPEHDGWLTPRERAVLERLKVSKRRRDWRLGRWTAKAALHAAWRAVCDRDPEPVLEILAAPDGAPELHGTTAPAPGFSLSHSGGTALCAVARPGVRVGCDLEQVEPRSNAFIQDFFVARERELVHASAADRRPLVANLIWSAKESALKALRTGLRLDTRRVAVRWSEGQPDGHWQPIEVSIAGDPQPLVGWWRAAAGSVLTLVSDPPTPPPTRLAVGAPI
jgi:4'-phosphopantetheinyl transferase